MLIIACAEDFFAFGRLSSLFIHFKPSLAPSPTLKVNRWVLMGII